MGSVAGRDGADAGEVPGVLLVDDNFGALETLVDILSLKGYRVDAVRSGDEAVAAVRGAAYRMVLMDIQMPGMNGVDALKQESGRPGALGPRRPHDRLHPAPSWWTRGSGPERST